LRIILHTGWRKTGTSAIQHLLYNNRALLRDAFSINYPEAGLFGRAHHLGGWILLGKSAPRRIRRPGTRPLARGGGFAEMLAETADTGCSTMLVSSEVLSQGDPSLPARLAEVLGGHRVEVIAYVRRQDRYIEARYNQRIKDGRLKVGLGEFTRDYLARPSLDYHEHFRRWAEAFGRESLKIRLYERAAFREGDVRRDLLDAIGIGDGALSFEEGQRNASLNFASVEFLRRLNSVPRAAIRRRHVLRFLEQRKGGSLDHTSLYAPAERRAVMEHYRESNRRFAAEFLGRDDVFEIPASELEREAGLDRAYGEEQFLDMLAFVLPRVVALPAGAGLRKKRKKDGGGARKGGKGRKGRKGKGRKRAPADAAARR
jgi:hypothetical protein